jgi:tetratricopeptide (TPR) repeat protein
MMAQFYSGRIEAAIDAGNRALALNPSNPDISAKLGSVLFAGGFYDSAVSLASDAARSPEAAPRDAVLVLALDAYRRGQWSDASLLAEQVNCSDFIVSTLRAASLGQLGSAQASVRLADLRSWDPFFEKDFRAHMTTRQYAPAFAASLRDGLAKAGAHFTPDGMAAN